MSIRKRIRTSSVVRRLSQANKISYREALKVKLDLESQKRDPFYKPVI